MPRSGQGDGKFPPGAVIGQFPEAGVLTRGAQHGVFPFLLPYLEQQQLYNQYDWAVSFNDPANQPAVTSHLRILQCPSAEPDRLATEVDHPNSWSGGACAENGRGLRPQLLRQRRLARGRIFLASDRAAGIDSMDLRSLRPVCGGVRHAHPLPALPQPHRGREVQATRGAHLPVVWVYLPPGNRVHHQLAAHR
jgi:hypothetical protein